MKGISLRYVLMVALLLAMGASVAFAADTASDGKVSTVLSAYLYCSVGDLLEGDVGLLIGLLLMFSGLWTLIQGGKMMAALPIMIVGSLVTALPTLIQSSLQGIGSLLYQQKISMSDLSGTSSADGSTGSGFPECRSQDAIKEDLMENMKGRSIGTFYPSPGAYTNPAVDCKPGDMRIDCR